jgi:hypothetical protein
MRQRPVEAARTPDNSCAYVAECKIGGRVFAARSRRGAPFALARELIACGVADQPVEVTHAGLRGAMRYPSLYRMAGLAVTESARRRVQIGRWKERADFSGGEAENRGDSASEVSGYRPADLALYERDAEVA